MPLIPCPSCKVNLSDAAPHCPHCGHPMRAITATPTPIASMAATPARAIAVPSTLDCPKCGSNNTQRVALTYADGTQRTRGGSVGVVAGELAVLGTSSASQTHLASSLAPPREREHGMSGFYALLAGGGALWFGSLYLEMSIAIAIGLATAIAIGTVVSRDDREWNEVELPKLHRDWNQRMLCKRCGATYAPDATSMNAAPSTQRFR